MKKLAISAVLSVFALGATGAQAAAEFPNKPVTIVVPYNPGGASDVTARVIAQGMEQKLGVPVVVTNKAGGSAASDSNTSAPANRMATRCLTCPSKAP